MSDASDASAAGGVVAFDCLYGSCALDERLTFVGHIQRLCADVCPGFYYYNFIRVFLVIFLAHIYLLANCFSQLFVADGASH